MYDETNCIYYNTTEKCNNENAEQYNTAGCTNCKEKKILKEGQEIEIIEKYTLTRKNGKVIKNKI